VGTTTFLGEVSAGLDVGRYSVRLSPRFQYFTIASYPYRKLSVAYVAVEGAMRVTPWYSVSLAPFAGYSYANTPPPCFDVCYSEPFSTAPTIGATLSPATFVFGPDGALEAGLHGQAFEYPTSGQLYLAANVGVRWFFLTRRAPE
jgi:hypothetical protein